MAQNRYVFAQRDVDDYGVIKILEELFKKFINPQVHVKFASEENAQGELPLKFDYDIKKNPNDVDTGSIDFRNYIGDILIEVVEKQLENGQVKFQK